MVGHEGRVVMHTCSARVYPRCAAGDAGSRGGIEAGSLSLDGADALLMSSLPAPLDGLGQLNVSSLLRRYLHASVPSPSLPVRPPYTLKETPSSALPVCKP